MGKAASADSPVLKWLSLLILAGTSVGFAMIFRYARLQPGKPFSNLSAVLASEMIKLLASMLAILVTTGASGFVECVTKTFWTERWQCLKMVFPGVLFSIQNYLFFVGISNLSVSLYQVSKQLGILATALVWVFGGGQRLSRDKWLALAVLTGGVMLVSLDGDISMKGSVVIGLSTVFGGCVCSALANVYTELLVKKGSGTIWECNMQFAICGVFLGLFGILTSELSFVQSEGVFRGFTWPVVLVVLIQSLGGLITSIVLKYSDSVMKCVTKSMVVGLCIGLSRVLFDEGPMLDDPRFIAGFFASVAGATWYAVDSAKLLAFLGLRDAAHASQPPQTIGNVQKSHSYVQVEAHESEESGNT